MCYTDQLPVHSACKHLYMFYSVAMQRDSLYNHSALPISLSQQSIVSHRFETMHNQSESLITFGHPFDAFSSMDPWDAVDFGCLRFGLRCNERREWREYISFLRCPAKSCSHWPVTSS